MKYELKNKIQKDSRAQKSKSSFINQLKVEYNLKENFNQKSLLSIIRKKNINNDNISEFQETKELNSYIISFSEINFSKWDFLNYLSGTKMLDKCKNDVKLLNDMYQRFIDNKLIEYEKTLLWNDKSLNINWLIKKPIISNKDKNGKKLIFFKNL